MTTASIVIEELDAGAGPARILAQVAEALHVAQLDGIARLHLRVWSIEDFARVLEAETKMTMAVRLARPPANVLMGLKVTKSDALEPGWAALMGGTQVRWLFDLRANLAVLGEVAS